MPSRYPAFPLRLGLAAAPCLLAAILPSAVAQAGSKPLPASLVLVQPVPGMVSGETAGATGNATGLFSGAGAARLDQLLALKEFAAILAFDGFTGRTAPGRSFVVNFYDGPDLRFTYGDGVIGASTATVTNPLYCTSPHDGALRLQASESGQSPRLIVRFGTWSGADFSADQTARAVGFTLTGNFANFTGRRATVSYHSATGEVLSVQNYAHDTSTQSSRGANQPAAAFTGYVNLDGASALDVAYVEVSFSAGATGPFILALDDFGFAPSPREDHPADNDTVKEHKRY